MGFFDFFKFSSSTQDKLAVAKAKKNEITKKCEAEHIAVDKEIAEAEASSKPIVPFSVPETQPATATPQSGGKRRNRKFSKKVRGGKRTTTRKKHRR